MESGIIMPNGKKAKIARIEDNPAFMVELKEGEFIPTVEECEYLLERHEGFRAIVDNYGSVTSSSMENGWIKSIERNYDFEPDAPCAILNGGYYLEQSECEERIGHCTTMVLKYI